MHLGIGDTLPLTDPSGKPRQLRLVGTLGHSMFQGEMLMSEANFRRLFPAQAGFGTVLVDVPADHTTDLQRLLNRELEPYAVSVDTTASRLAEFQKIMNTYLDTFSLLGALGLALGSIGLAVVLIRNVIERRPELALLSALGFKPGDRVTLVLSENVFLLVLGLIVGALCAFLGILPTVLGAKAKVAWMPLLLTLMGVLVLGFIASAVAVIFSGVRTTTADLRRE
jgi:ABC-type antimicrobial peptide transport system permease subunit